MSSRCACCHHPERAALDEAILSGSRTHKDIAREFSVDPSGVSRHKRKHLQSPEPDAPVTIEQEIQTWMARSEELWNLAASNADVRGLAQALAQGLKGLEFSLKRKEEAQAQKLRELPHDLTVWGEEEKTRFRNYLDWVMSQRVVPAVTAAIPPGIEEERVPEPESDVFPMVRVI
jgi:hypothetical protein